MILEILSQYAQIIPQAEGYAIQCPWCKDDSKSKMLYFYPSGKTICFRCRDKKDRKWTNAWACLNEVLKKLGVDNRKLLSYNGSLNFIGNSVATKIAKYDNHEFIPAKDHAKTAEFIKNRNLDIDKIGEFLFYGTKGPMEGKICWNLFPTGKQCRSLDKKEYRIYNQSHNNAIFTPDPITKVNELFIVEGCLDALTLHQYGYAAIGMIGVHTSAYLKQVIGYKEPESIYLYLDPDEAGKKGTEKLVKYLASGQQELYIITGNQEPGDSTEEEIHEAIRTASPVDYKEVYK